MADGTSATVAADTTLPRFPVALMAAEKHLEQLGAALSVYGTVVYASIRSTAEAGDPTSSDVFTEISRELDQLLWKIEAHQIPS